MKQVRFRDDNIAEVGYCRQPSSLSDRHIASTTRRCLTLLGELEIESYYNKDVLIPKPLPHPIKIYFGGRGKGRVKTYYMAPFHTSKYLLRESFYHWTVDTAWEEGRKFKSSLYTI